MKPRGYIKLFRKELLELNKLTGSEFKIYCNLWARADWDSRHANFEIATGSLRDLAKELNQSASTLSRNINSLVLKGFVSRKADGKIKVSNLHIFQEPVRIAEQLLSLREQGVPITEQLVQELRQRDPRLLEIQKRKLAEKMRAPPY